MTSKDSKKRRFEKSCLKRVWALAGLDPFDPDTKPLDGAVMADQTQLVFNSTYGPRPRFYIDQVVVCRKCGEEEVWAAER